MIVTRVGIAEAICQNGREELHITVTNETAEVDAKTTANRVTIISVDINEDYVALAALTESGIEDSMIIDYPEIKGERHRYFTMRKRIREVGQTFLTICSAKRNNGSFTTSYTLSRRVVVWIQRFGSSVIFFEELTDMRDDIEYGARTNRCLHSLPSAKLRDFITYKAAWEETPSDDVDPSTPASNAQFVVTQHGRTDARSGSSAVSANIKTMLTVALT